MNSLFDTHCHLNLPHYQKDISEVINRAKNNQVEYLLIPGIDSPSSIDAINLCVSYENMFAACGLHPNSKINDHVQELRLIKNQLKNNGVVAIGEIGLDFFREHNTKDFQITIFEAHLQFAKEIEKPIIIHNRLADDTLWSILENWHKSLPVNSILKNRPGVLHAFSGSAELARKAIDLNFSIGIAGSITYHNADNLRDIISKLPLQSIILETDSPYLTPHPKRGERNEPSFLSYTAQQLCKIFNIEMEQIKKITTENALNLFNKKSH